jgi:formate/nitrite transporter FocA (FNT family)
MAIRDQQQHEMGAQSQTASVRNERTSQDQGHEEQEVSNRSSPSGRVLYKAVLKEADEELSRPSSALFWSGLAAGLSMGFSMMAEGLMRHYLPRAQWTPLVSRLGYSVGFIVVILGRQQLFTENTLTPMLPLLKRKDGKTLLNVLRLWGVVLIANMIGALAIGFVAARTEAFESAVRGEFASMGREAMGASFGTLLLRGIFAGWLIALLVWMLPFAESSHFFVIVLMTWLIGTAHFAHIIAGAVEVFALGWAGLKPWSSIFGGYIVPVLIGNIVGGVTLVAAVNHAQIASGKTKET